MGKFWETVKEIFCCDCCRRHSIDNISANKDEKSKGMSTESVSAKYGTNWETVVNEDIEMTPSMIDDTMVTKQLDETKLNLPEQLGFNWYKVIAEYNGYELLENGFLGSGSFGQVYTVKDVKTDKLFAFKIMHMRNMSEKFSQSRFQSFKNEIFTIRRTAHRNVIELIDHFIIKRPFSMSFMVLELATGGDLHNKIKRKFSSDLKGLPEAEAKTYFAQISNAMHFLHTKNIIHGDLKLENILIVIDPKGKQVIKVTDFGCARIGYKDGEGYQLKNRATGTVPYMAPEQLRVYISVNLNKPELFRREFVKYNPFRADIWSLGVCLYRMLFWEKPFSCDDWKDGRCLSKVVKEMKKGIKLPVKTHVSANCSQLLKDILEYNKENRIDVNIVMRSKWLFNCPELDAVPRV